MGITAAVTFRDIGHAGKLPMLEYAVRQPQPAHIAVLRRRDIEQAVEAPAKIIRRLGVFVPGGELLQPVIGIEGMLLAFEFFRVRQLAAALQDAILRLQRGGIGTLVLRNRRRRRRRPGGGCTARKASRRLGYLQAGETKPSRYLFCSG